MSKKVKTPILAIRLDRPLALDKSKFIKIEDISTNKDGIISIKQEFKPFPKLNDKAIQVIAEVLASGRGITIKHKTRG